MDKSAAQPMFVVIVFVYFTTYYLHDEYTWEISPNQYQELTKMIENQPTIKEKIATKFKDQKITRQEYRQIQIEYQKNINNQSKKQLEKIYGQNSLRLLPTTPHTRFNGNLLP